MPKLLGLLKGIDATGTLSGACKDQGLSYRHAWGLLRHGQEIFGAPLIVKEKGRGSRLAPLGETLVWADRRIAARLSPSLDSLATELEAEIERRVLGETAILHVHASHGFAVETLRDFLVRAQIPVELKYRTSLESVAALASLSCDVAGFHVPTGEFEQRALAHYVPWLNPAEMVLINAVTRRQGLMVARGNPRKIYGLKDLARPDIEFINRQLGSGTRLLLDLLLEREGVAPRSIRGFENCEYTHAAVAAFVASGKADAGFGVETPARQFDLEFMPLHTERYFLLCRRDALLLSQVQRMLAVMRSEAYNDAIRILPGYRPNQTGSVLELGDAFPGWN
ncbi:MAG: substrate-binding domain-containing protein [Burkholderiaceae bacterium]